MQLSQPANIFNQSLAQVQQQNVFGFGYGFQPSAGNYAAVGVDNNTGLITDILVRELIVSASADTTLTVYRTQDLLVTNVDHAANLDSSGPVSKSYYRIYNSNQLVAGTQLFQFQVLAKQPIYVPFALPYLLTAGYGLYVVPFASDIAPYVNMVFEEL